MNRKDETRPEQLPFIKTHSLLAVEARVVVQIDYKRLHAQQCARLIYRGTHPRRDFSREGLVVHVFHHARRLRTAEFLRCFTRHPTQQAQRGAAVTSGTGFEPPEPLSATPSTRTRPNTGRNALGPTRRNAECVHPQRPNEVRDRGDQRATSSTTSIPTTGALGKQLLKGVTTRCERTGPRRPDRFSHDAP